MKSVEDIITVTKKGGMLQLPNALKGDAPLEEQGLDSLDIVMLLHAVEENFGVRIPQEKTTQLRSLQDIVDFVNANT
jgi:acyl carrier protein